MDLKLEVSDKAKDVLSSQGLAGHLVETTIGSG